jgi:REP element-mobilizing transposase RayT
MTIARKSLVSLATTEYYHYISRCVRRAFLCGTDAYSGACYEHRRQWLEDRLLLLAKFFAIDIAAYAIMSNHYHVVLHVNRTKAQQWSDQEVVKRWHGSFAGTALSSKFLSEGLVDAGEIATLQKLVSCWRERLMDISWFMRRLNESIARQSNQEDKVTGRFWEGRFKSQALLDESALLACMAYVDLNPIRAKKAETPEGSHHTSIRRRIAALYRTDGNNQPEELMPFIGGEHTTQEACLSGNGLTFDFPMYLNLVESTGRIVRGDKLGAISKDAAHILERLNISQEHWIYLANNFHSPFKNLVGCYHRLKDAYGQLGLRRTAGEKACVLYFGT